MPRIRLRLDERRRFAALGPDGRAREVVYTHLVVRVLIPGKVKPVDAILDTGAPLSQFPIDDSKPLLGSADAPGLAFVIPEHRTAPLDRLPLYTIKGRTYRARHAWLDVTPVDAADDAVRLAPTPVLAALFVERVELKTVGGKPAWVRRDEDAKGLQEVVMGVGAGVLDGRYLVLSPHQHPARRLAYLQDERPPDPPPPDRVSTRILSLA